MEIAALVISAISLLLAIASFVMSFKAQHLQNKVNEFEVRIKEFELAEIEKVQKEKNSSCVEARLVRIARGNYKLKVWNSGNTRVDNVIATIPEEYKITIVNDKMPFEYLDPRKGFEVNAVVHSGSSRKFRIITEWIDNDGNSKKKEQMGDV